MRGIGALAGATLPRTMTARLAGWRSRPTALVWQPAPPAEGDPAIARRLAAGVLLFDGRLVETQDPLPWQIEPPDHVWQDELHGHGWLDHAAASPDTAVRDHLVGWVWDWLDRFDDGADPGWAPELVARRLTRWIAHSALLLRGREASQSDAFFRSLGAQTRYLEWRWRETRPGAERIEALAGLVYATLSLEGQEQANARAIADLGREASRIVGETGGISSRNPEQLARVLTLLDWSARSLEDADLKPSTGHLVAIQRVRPAVQALRHPSGSLARFNGGRSGAGLLQGDLAPRGSTVGPTPDRAMGYLRIAEGPGLLIADGAGPGDDSQAGTDHAGALAFEFSYEMDEIIVNCGSGLGFGLNAGVDARRGPAHSAVEVGERCPGRLRPGKTERDQAQLTFEGTVGARIHHAQDGTWLMGESEQYCVWFGLSVERRIRLSKDGTKLSGEDTVLAKTAETRARVAKAFPDPAKPCPIRARFHLHPSVEAGMALNGKAVALKLPDESRWLMTTDAEILTIEPSRYYDETRPKPRATSQIVVGSEVLEYWGRMSWRLERLPDGTTPLQAKARGA